MTAVDIRVLADAGDVAREAAAITGKVLAEIALPAERTIFLALSGGTSPRGMYERLAADYKSAVPWDRVHVLWGDERCVPPADPRSNYRMALETGMLDLPLAGVHPMPGGLPPAEGARRYEEALRALFPDVVFPTLDLAVLGIGADGHTASLVPGAPVLREAKRWVAAAGSYQGTERLTLTLPVLARAEHLLFLVSGEAKAEIMGEVLGPYADTQSSGRRDARARFGERPGSAGQRALPVQILLDAVAERVEGTQGGETAAPRITWVIDEDAAARLQVPGGTGD